MQVTDRLRIHKIKLAFVDEEAVDLRHAVRAFRFDIEPFFDASKMEPVVAVKKSRFLTILIKGLCTYHTGFLYTSSVSLN